MSEPSREHIKAVADYFAGIDMWYPDEEAAALLTSTDPAVLDAMQDALVRAGRLREERRTLPGRGDRGETLRPHRFVTEWKEREP